MQFPLYFGVFGYSPRGTYLFPCLYPVSISCWSLSRVIVYTQVLVKRGLRSAYEEKTMGADSKNITVSEADAKKTALDRVSGATDKDLYEWKLDYDDGRPEYEGKIIYGGTEYEFTIDAATGSVMEWDAEKVR